MTIAKHAASPVTSYQLDCLIEPVHSLNVKLCIDRAVFQAAHNVLHLPNPTKRSSLSCVDAAPSNFKVLLTYQDIFSSSLYWRKDNIFHRCGGEVMIKKCMRVSKRSAWCRASKLTAIVGICLFRSERAAIMHWVFGLYSSSKCDGRLYHESIPSSALARILVDKLLQSVIVKQNRLAGMRRVCEIKSSSLKRANHFYVVRLVITPSPYPAQVSQLKQHWNLYWKLRETFVENFHFYLLGTSSSYAWKE